MYKLSRANKKKEIKPETTTYTLTITDGIRFMNKWLSSLANNLLHKNKFKICKFRPT